MTILAKLLAFLRSLLGLPTPWRFVAVEIMGFRKHFGLAREIRWLGARFLEVEDLERDEGQVERIRYGSSAIFSFKWLSNEEGQRRLEAHREERRREEERSARWRAEAEEQEKRRERGKALRDAVVGAVAMGTVTREGLMTWLLGEPVLSAPDVTGAEAREAIEGAVYRWQIVEDPEGSGAYRLPTEEEEARGADEIPF